MYGKRLPGPNELTVRYRPKAAVGSADPMDASEIDDGVVDDGVAPAGRTIYRHRHPRWRRRRALGNDASVQSYVSTTLASGASPIRGCTLATSRFPTLGAPVECALRVSAITPRANRYQPNNGPNSAA